MSGLKRLAATVMIGWIVVGCRSASSDGLPPTPMPPQPRCALAADRAALCILVLGDSIASGFPLEGADRWWAQLGALSSAALANRRVVVDSWAVPGSRVEVLESAARDQPALGAYDVAIVIEGVNDQAALPLEAWRARYEAAIAAIERRGPVVVVATPPPSFEHGAFKTRYDATAAALREVAAGGRVLLDLAARWRADGEAVAATYYSDLIHQGPVGQRLMAEVARDAVLEAIAVRR